MGAAQLFWGLLWTTGASKAALRGGREEEADKKTVKLQRRRRRHKKCPFPSFSFPFAFHDVLGMLRHRNELAGARFGLIP